MRYGLTGAVGTRLGISLHPTMLEFLGTFARNALRTRTSKQRLGYRKRPALLRTGYVYEVYHGPKIMLVQCRISSASAI